MRLKIIRDLSIGAQQNMVISHNSRAKVSNDASLQVAERTLQDAPCLGGDKISCCLTLQNSACVAACELQNGIAQLLTHLPGLSDDCPLEECSSFE